MDNTEKLDPDVLDDVVNDRPIEGLLPSRKTYGMFNDSNIEGRPWDVEIGPVGPIDVVVLSDHKVVDRYTVEL